MPKLGTPHLLRRWKMFGSSRSRAMRNWIVIRSTIAVLTAESRSKPKTMLTMNTEGVTERRPERAADKNFAHVTQHVIAHALRARRVDVAVGDLQSAERVHGEAEQRGENADFDHDPQNCGRGSFAHGWLRVGAAGIESHHAGGVGDRFDAGKREHDSDKPGPVRPEAAVQRLQMTDRFAHVRQTEKSEHDDDDHGWHRNQKARPPVCFGPSRLSNPMMRMAAAANFSGCGTPRY